MRTLAKWLVKNEISVAELARQASAYLPEKQGVSPSYVSRLSNGLRRPRLPIAVAIAKATGWEIGPEDLGLSRAELQLWREIRDGAYR